MAEAKFARVSRGYDRGQVDAFLLELNRTHAEKEAAWEDQKRELEAALEEAKAAHKKSEDGSGEQEKALRNALEEKERECESLQASIGKRMLMADARADEIIADAERKAEEIRADAEREAAELMEKARRDAAEEGDRIIAEIQTKCAVIGQAADAFSKRIGSISAEMREAENDINDSLVELRRKALEGS